MLRHESKESLESQERYDASMAISLDEKVRKS